MRAIRRAKLLRKQTSKQLRALIYVALISLAEKAHAGGVPTQPQYTANASSLSSFAADIQKNLKPELRHKLAANPHLPAHLVELINNLSHAEAIQKKDHSYFEKYLAALETADEQPVPLPQANNPAYWSDTVINEQVSNFNSIAGILLSLDIAHQFLGHYEKYGGPATINQKINAEDFEKAFHIAVRNALEVGITVEGLKGILDAIEKSKTRPAWTLAFLPESANYAKLKKALQKSQRDYFAGK